MEDQEEVQQSNMISNLPLLFANGYPTSLEKITEPQLENFIPFMVQCSLGFLNLQGKIDCSEPEWWPEDVPFTIPLSKPKKFNKNWMEKMREIVIICYQFHRSIFLLRFCNDLASYEHASLRFINNQNLTTSLFDRRSNKLLVTFRNENMSYDQPQRFRKCLLQQKPKNGLQSGSDLQQLMVEPAPFDIYLCDNCDAELYSTEAIVEHEKTCKIDDDDVIICDTPEPQDEHQPLHHNDMENRELRIGFFLNFGLQFNDDGKNRCTNGNEQYGSSLTAKEDNGFKIVDKNRRMPRRNRTIQWLTRCPTIPLSSPAGQLLLRTTKTTLTQEYLTERLERIERFCHAPALSKTSNRPKYFDRKLTGTTPHCTFKKPQEYSTHIYVFPRRQFSQRSRVEDFFILNSQLIKRCRPISVRLKKITKEDINVKRNFPSTKLNIKLTRDTSRSSNWKIATPSNETVVETIDLCSSDEDDYPGGSAKSAILGTNVSLDSSLKANIASSPHLGNLHKNRPKSKSHCFRSADVSIIPVNVPHRTKKPNTSPSFIKIVAPTEIVAPERSTNSHYEGNLLLSPSPMVVPENSVGPPKPLQPSVYIFSNYTTSPLTAILTSSNEIVSTVDHINLRGQNQENHAQNNTGGNIVAKRSNNTGVTTPNEWFPNTFVSNPHGVSPSNSNQLVERELTPRNLALVPSFGSPGRILSIDLTS